MSSFFPVFMYFVLKQEVWTEHTEKLIFLYNQQSLVHEKPMNHDLQLAIDNQSQVILSGHPHS